MAELGGPLGRAQYLNKKPKYESPAARLARLKEEALVRRRKVPLDGASFSGFLRTGRFG